MTEWEGAHTKTSTETISLDHERERELLAGTAVEVDSTAQENGALARFGEQLQGYQENDRRQEVWVRRVHLPNGGTPAPGETVEFEFLLPSDDTFTRSFTVPPRAWPSDDPFVRFLDTIGRSPANLSGVLGDAVPVEHDGEEWSLDLSRSAADTADSSEQPTMINSVFLTLVSLLVISQVILPVGVAMGSPSTLALLPLLLGGVAIALTVVYLVTDAR